MLAVASFGFCPVSTFANLLLSIIVGFIPDMNAQDNGTGGTIESGIVIPLSTPIRKDEPPALMSFADASVSFTVDAGPKVSASPTTVV